MPPGRKIMTMPSPTGNRPKTLEQTLGRIQARTAKIGIIGLGYVGLPLALLFNEAGFPVTGFDIDPEKGEGPEQWPVLYLPYSAN